ncbi:uncharacterized protein LOC135154107 [Lytechinus pictus]|uniref:uncharacterized protein LOC135154107 n=1 Tax=Lytechinus pictus TaxID=7653 RepID=UPI0030B9FD00
MVVKKKGGRGVADNERIIADVVYGLQTTNERIGDKNLTYMSCHVLECLAGLAQDVITTVGQAFEIRFKDYLRNPPQVFSTPDRMEEPLFQEEESAWGDDPDYYNDISKLNVTLPDRVVPPPPSGQYMPTSPTRQQPYQELIGQQASGGSSPAAPPPGYTANPPSYLDSNHHPSNSSPTSSNPRGPQGPGPGHQPMTGRLIDIDNEPPIYGATAGTPSPTRNNVPTALDNPLQRSSRHTSSSSPHLSPQHSPIHNNNVKKPSRKAKRRTPSLYNNPPTKEDVEASLLPLAKQLTPAERNHYQNVIASPDWKKLVDSGYDNLRMLNIWKQSKSVMLHKGGDDEAEYANVVCFHDDLADDDGDDEHGNRNDGEEEKEEEEVDDARNARVSLAFSLTTIPFSTFIRRFFIINFYYFFITFDHFVLIFFCFRAGRELFGIYLIHIKSCLCCIHNKNL